MKEYNRKTKKWEYPEVTTENVGDLKLSQLCLHKLPHNFALVLPDYLQGKNIDLSPEAIQAYYDSEDRVAEFVANEVDIKIKAGISLKYHDKRRQTKYYECVVCGKKEYDIYEPSK